MGPLARIIARWISGGLVTAGFLLPSEAQSIATDPDVLMLIGVGLSAITEGFYALAKKRGWKL